MHFRKHGAKLGSADEAEYDASARETIRTGRRFAYQDPASGQGRLGYFDRRSGLLTALTDDEAIIVTHFLTDEQYVRQLPGSTFR
jgi:hypothetical protein